MPIPAILGGILAGLTIKEILGPMFAPFKEAFYDEVAEGYSRLMKWNMFKQFAGGLKKFAACFDDITEADPDQVSGISGRGLVDIFDVLISLTVELSAMIGDEMAEELLLELLQEGVSNAIQTSIGGAFQTILNVYRGGQPIYGDDVTNIPEIWDNLDDKISAFNAASSGLNFPALVHYLTRGVKSKLDDDYRDASHIASAILIRAIDEELWWLTTYLELARNNILSKLRYAVDVATKYAELAIDGINNSISRLNDILQEISTEIARLDAGLSVEEYAIGIYNELKAEFDALKTETNKFIDTMTNIISSVTHSLVQDDINRYNNALMRYRSAISRMLGILNDSFINDMNEQFEKIARIIDMILAYRYYADRANYTDIDAQAVSVIGVGTGISTMAPAGAVIATLYETA